MVPTIIPRFIILGQFKLNFKVNLSQYKPNHLEIGQICNIRKSSISALFGHIQGSFNRSPWATKMGSNSIFFGILSASYRPLIRPLMSSYWASYVIFFTSYSTHIRPFYHHISSSIVEIANQYLWLDSNVSSFDNTCQIKISHHSTILVRNVFSFPTTRKDLIKLPLFLIKCKAMMGICIYWPDTDTQRIWKKVLRNIPTYGTING